MDKKDTKNCPRCKKELPLFKKDGRHNFVPAADGLEEICIRCKIKEVYSIWKSQ